MRISDWSSDVCSSDLVSLPYVPSTHPIYSDAGNTTSLVLGFPIRTPSDHSSVDSSPRLIAASYVLHRLLVPRHPPYALTHLQTLSKQNKDARIHCAILKQHTPTTPNTRKRAESSRHHRQNPSKPTSKCVPSGPNPNTGRATC